MQEKQKKERNKEREKKQEMTEQIEVTRRRRRDAGLTKITGRDVQTIAWIAEMRAIAEPDLGVLLGRLNPKQGGRPVAEDGVLRVVGRWEALGLAESRRVLVGGPRVVTLTARGAGYVMPEAKYVPPALATLTHTLEVARVRLYLEGKYDPALGKYGPALAEWITEHRWKAEHLEEGPVRRRTPDGVAVMNDGRRFLVEVELTAKAPARTVAILVDLLQREDYTAVLFYCGSEAVLRAVEVAAEEVRPKFAGRPAPEIRVALLPRLRPEVAA